MPIDLLNYAGNAGLGLGSNPDIDANSINLATLNGTMRDIQLQDNEKNIKLFNQKVKDRDNLENLILQNQVATGEIDPKDQKYFDQAKGEVEKAYSDWGGNFNDTNGFRKYQQAVTGLQSTATHAQTRWAGIKKQQQELSQETLPSRIKARKEWLDKQESQPFGNQIVPYQQLHDFSIDDINGGVIPIKGSIVDPNNPITYDTSVVDYGQILQAKKNDYINDMDKADSMDQFASKIMKYNQPQLQKTIGTMDAKIAQYNAERGFQEGDQGYVAPVKVQKNDDGSVLIAEPATELAAKWALTNQDSYVTRTPKFNKDILKGQYDAGRLKLLEDRNKILARKVGVEATKANAYARHLDAATKKILDEAKDEGTDITQEYNDFIDNIKPGAIILSTGGKKTGNLDAIYMDEMPANFQYINGPVVGKDGKVTAGRLLPFVENSKKQIIKDEFGKPVEVNAGKQYYIPKYINPTTGEKLDLNSLPADVEEGWKAAKDAGLTKPEYIKVLLKKGILELQLQGKNGIVNKTSLSQSARVLNNLGGAKKGQENIINPPQSSPDEPEPAEEPATNPETN